FFEDLPVTQFLARLHVPQLDDALGRNRANSLAIRREGGGGISAVGRAKRGPHLALVHVPQVDEPSTGGCHGLAVRGKHRADEKPLGFFQSSPLVPLLGGLRFICAFAAVASLWSVCACQREVFFGAFCMAKGTRAGGKDTGHNQQGYRDAEFVR